MMVSFGRVQATINGHAKRGFAGAHEPAAESIRGGCFVGGNGETDVMGTDSDVSGACRRFDIATQGAIPVGRLDFSCRNDASAREILQSGEQRYFQSLRMAKNLLARTRGCDFPF